MEGDEIDNVSLKRDGWRGEMQTEAKREKGEGKTERALGFSPLSWETMGKPVCRGQTEAGTDDIRARGEQKRGAAARQGPDGERKTPSTAAGEAPRRLEVLWREEQAVPRNGVLLMPVAQIQAQVRDHRAATGHTGEMGSPWLAVSPTGTHSQAGGTLAWIPEARTSAGRRVLLHGGGVTKAREVKAATSVSPLSTSACGGWDGGGAFCRWVCDRVMTRRHRLDSGSRWPKPWPQLEVKRQSWA